VTDTVAATKQLEVVVYEAAGLGDRSYLLHDGEKAFVVDPQRDPAPFLETAASLGVEITLVLETHVHNDYVSGAWLLPAGRGPLTASPPECTSTSPLGPGLSKRATCSVWGSCK